MQKCCCTSASTDRTQNSHSFPEVEKQQNIWRVSKREMTPEVWNLNVVPACVCSSPVSHRVPEGEERSGQQLLADQKPLVLGEPARHVLSQPSVLSSRAQRQGGREREEPNESVYLQRWFDMFRLQGEFLQPGHTLAG